MRSAILILLLGGSCGGEPPPASRCEEAHHAFLACGVSVPLIADGPCVGLRESAADCIMESAGSCLDLAKLTRRPDTCFDMLFDPPEVEEPTEPLFPEQPERWDQRGDS